MKGGKVFVDTNILVYAYDSSTGKKQDIAAALVARLWDSPVLPAVSVQVLQELFVTLTKRGVAIRDAENIIRAYLEWDVIDNTATSLISAIAEQKKFKLSFWDASILSAARSAACSELLTEDFNAGQNYGGIVTVNPF